MLVIHAFSSKVPTWVDRCLAYLFLQDKPLDLEQEGAPSLLELHNYEATEGDWESAVKSTTNAIPAQELTLNNLIERVGPRVGSAYDWHIFVRNQSKHRQQLAECAQHLSEIGSVDWQKLANFSNHIVGDFYIEQQFNFVKVRTSRTLMQSPMKTGRRSHELWKL